MYLNQLIKGGLCVGIFSGNKITRSDHLFICDGFLQNRDKMPIKQIKFTLIQYKQTLFHHLTGLAINWVIHINHTINTNVGKKESTNPEVR